MTVAPDDPGSCSSLDLCLLVSPVCVPSGMATYELMPAVSSNLSAKEHLHLHHILLMINIWIFKHFSNATDKINVSLTLIFIFQLRTFMFHV